ncbi:MAG: translocation/assembly module TamB domain-containing protein [Candidatus Deferrimicrobiaceae bacterium]
MARRWAWRIGLGLFLVVLLAFGVRRLLQEIPPLLAKAEDTIREEARALGLRVSYRALRFHPLHLRVSLEELDIRDNVADIPLAHAGRVDVSLSLRRILSGALPVSRVIVRTFSVQAGEANRPLLDKLRASGKDEGQEETPEILLIDGTVRIRSLGPLAEWEAKIPELRIRPVRFLGTRVTVKVEQAAGRIALPKAGIGNVPFDSAEADVFLKGGIFRVRKISASGPSVHLALSGEWDGGRRVADLKGSGEAGIGGWMASGAPGGDWLRRVATEGKLAFSAQWRGSPENPEGSVKVLTRNLVFTGNTPAAVEVLLGISGKTVRVESLRGNVWGGVVSGEGRYDFPTGKGDARLSVAQAAFGKAPWDSGGISWRPAGRGDLVLSVAGGKDKIQGTVSLKNPGGFERPERKGVPAVKVALPVAAAVAGEFVPGKEVKIQNFRVTAGKAEAGGRGSYIPREKRLSFTGTFLAPRGKAAEYGWAYPVSWGSLAGEWTLSGTVENPHVTAGVRAKGLAAKALPPVPLSVKLEGNPTDVVHFVADIPADVAKVTATGTISGPASHNPVRLESTVGAREIDFSLAGEWGAAVLTSLGKDPARLREKAAGMSGTGTADLQLSVARGSFSVSGTMSSSEVRFPGISAREVSVSGNWRETPFVSSWGFHAGGQFGEGKFVLAGEGEDGKAAITGTMDDIDLATAVSLAHREYGARIGGRANLRVEARTGPEGWEIGKLSASVPRLTAAGLAIEGVVAEGSLGGSSGELSLVSTSPRVKASAVISRERGWPVSFTVRTEGVPTGVLLEAIGRGETTSGGTWDADAEGALKAADLFEGKTARPEAISEFRFSLSASSLSIAGISFDSLHAEGKKERDVLTGEIGTSLPDSLLSYSFSLREPYGFRVKGSFSAGQPNDAAAAGGVPDEPRKSVSLGEDEHSRFRIAGQAELSGSLLALDRFRGTLQLERIFYRYGEVDLTGEGISIVLSSEGIRWESGTVQTAGNPLRVFGKATWAGDMDLRLAGNVPAPAIRMVTDVFDRLDGMLQVEIRVTGKWDNPSVIGTGHVENATFSFRGYAQLFEKMNVDAVISREKIIFEHFEGRSGGGYLDGRGELPLRFAEGQRMFFSVDFFDMQYPYPEDLHPVLQGRVELIGPVNDLLITGDVEVQSARYTKTVRPERALLDFRKRLADVTARRQETDFRIRLDLDAVADGTIHVQNNLAEADIKGEFKVVGDTSRVIILGSFDVTEGRVDYRENRYVLTRGALEFQDPRRNNPGLDFQAETKKGNVLVTVSVTGTLEKYEVELSSDPPYSKNEIVSLLSLGVTSGSLAGAAGSLPAAEAASIALVPVTGRVTEEIRTVIGLDKFAIEPSFSTRENVFEPRFIVGKSFGDRFSVSVSTNVGTTTESSAEGEFKVLENVYLVGTWESATTTKEGDLGVDVKFRYRYRTFKDLFRDRD